MRSTLLLSALFLPSLCAFRGQHPTEKLPTSCIPRDNPSLLPQALPSHHINDNYCHCLLGEDEPGTSACPNGTFWCQNRFYKPIKIPSSFVDDGNCDCCDGSDEPEGQCPDVCEQLRGKELQVAQERAGIIKKGAQVRRGYVREAKRSKEKDLREIERIEKELKEVETKLKESERKAELLRKRKDFEESLGGSEDDGEDPPLNRQDDHDIDEHFNNDADKYIHDDYDDDDDDENGEDSQDGQNENDGDQQVVDHEVLDEENDEVSKLEEPDVVHDEDPIKEARGDDMSAPPSEDDPITQPDDDSGDVASDVKDSTDQPATSVDSICAEFESTGSNSVTRFIVYVRSLVRLKLARLIPKMLRPKQSNSKSQISTCLERADSSKWDLESRKRDLESNLQKLREKNGIDYGTDGALRQLHGRCHKKKLGQYEFEHCPFDLVRQYEHGSAIAILGRFSGWENGKMSYPSGDHCWNGPARSIMVELACGKTEDIVSVEEPNRCAYAMKFETPAVCDEAAAEAILAEFHGNETEPKQEL